MKTKTEIIEITHEDLVNLFSTATYGSCWLDASVSEEDRLDLDIDDEDCREDVWAKAILSGEKVSFVDLDAEETSYGSLENHADEQTGIVEYRVGLEDIKRGLCAAADGDFRGDDEEKSFVRNCFTAFASEDQLEFDKVCAENLFQVILFGEIIYG